MGYSEHDFTISEKCLCTCDKKFEASVAREQSTEFNIIIYHKNLYARPILLEKTMMYLRVCSTVGSADIPLFLKFLW